MKKIIRLIFALMLAAAMLTCHSCSKPEDKEGQENVEPGGDNPGGDNPDNPGGGDKPGGDDPDNPGGGDNPGGEDPDNPGGDNPGGDDPDPPVDAPEGYGALPTAAQVAWQKMETNMFIHFGPNTFTNKEWGDGTDDEIRKFNPSAVDCDAWASIAKETGFKGIILTAKHHDGFCLWPNPYSTHTIAYSPYKNGDGDILKELSDACAKHGVKFGVYDSPWDRHDPNYGTGTAYNQIFANTLKDLHTNYGDMFEQWFDGAKGSDGKPQEYDFGLFDKTVTDLHPDAIIFSNVGPGCRWVGNEYGFARETNWSTFSPERYGATQSSLPGDYGTYLGSGTEGGAAWIPAEADVSIRTKNQQDNGDPMWFWNNLGNEKTRSAKNLMKLYYQTVGRNAVLLLNVPPTTAGVFDEADIASLRGFKKMKDEIFAKNLAEGAGAEATRERGGRYGPANLLDGDYDTYFATGDADRTVDIVFTLKERSTFNRVLLQEYIPLGQRVKGFTVYYKSGDSWIPLQSGTTIGYKRILLTQRVTTDAVKVSVTSSLACPVLNGFGLYDDSVSGLSDSDLDKK